jgi:hypothetical protein
MNDKRNFYSWINGLYMTDAGQIRVQAFKVYSAIGPVERFFRLETRNRYAVVPYSTLMRENAPSLVDVFRKRSKVKYVVMSTLRGYNLVIQNININPESHFTPWKRAVLITTAMGTRYIVPYSTYKRKTKDLTKFSPKTLFGKYLDKL